MSEYITRLDVFEKTKQEKRQRLQSLFESRGGVGDVRDFLEMGARDPDSREDTHWETMPQSDRQLWLDLHKSGLTDLSRELEKLMGEDPFH